MIKNKTNNKLGKVIAISTRRYSCLMKRILSEYGINAEIYIDGLCYKEEDISELMNKFCTNEKLKNTNDFTLIKDGTELFGFHDHPSDFWCNISELEFIKSLAKEKIVRYRVVEIKKYNIFYLLIFRIIISLIMGPLVILSWALLYGFPEQVVFWFLASGPIGFLVIWFMSGFFFDRKTNSK